MFDKQFSENHFGKEHRKQYTRLCQLIDHTCRCHGSCDYCKGNRLFFDLKKRKAVDAELKEWKFYQNF